MKHRLVKKILIAFLFALLTTYSFSMVTLRKGNAETIANNLVIEANKDYFKRFDIEKTSKESFVYSAEAYFESGNACGLAFGMDEDCQTSFVFNVDRASNRVKLLYFSKVDEGYKVVTIKEDYFIGNENTTQGEFNMINPKVQNLDRVDLKVAVEVKEDGTYLKVYADGIQRLRTTYEENESIKISTIENETPISYQGGYLGVNCFDAKVNYKNVDVLNEDYSYYGEIYRNQYHFSQYAHWNNDPNGLVYYNGYYHLYYQHHPYAKGWGDMYWGHARSKDLVHWENLPIALFPDDGTIGKGLGNGYAWSGSAMVYKRGMGNDSEILLDGEEDCLLGFYTRDGAMQDQVIMASHDEGISWVRIGMIPQTVATLQSGLSNKESCRDPKVFEVKNKTGERVKWGMALSGKERNKIWFLQSDDLVHWEAAGQLDIFEPECPDVAYLKADDNNTYAVMTFTGRQYLVGQIEYSDNQIKFLDLDGNLYNSAQGILFETDIDGSKYPVAHGSTQVMDYGPDSYATQSFYISDPESKYYGKNVSMSWFSGTPDNHIADNPSRDEAIEGGIPGLLRDPWNGGGFTIPVIWGLKMIDGKLQLTQTPILKDYENSLKENIAKMTNASVADANNELAKIKSHGFELSATVENPDGDSIAFQINANEDEYFEVGWNATDGYYVDRTYTGDGGLIEATKNNNPNQQAFNYRRRFNSKILGSSTVKSFYILSDEGGVEVFCEDFTVPFYVLTFSSLDANKASFDTDGDNVSFTSLEINSIGSSYSSFDRIMTTQKSLEMDLTFVKTSTIMVYSQKNVQCEIVKGEDVISMKEENGKLILESQKAGEAMIEIKTENNKLTIPVTVYGGRLNDALELDSDCIKNGSWLVDYQGLIGKYDAGDAFILSKTMASDFIYKATIDLQSGVAAALVLRASQDLSSYIIVNYDNNSHRVKAWSNVRGIQEVEVDSVGFNLRAIELTVYLNGRNMTVSLNGKAVMNVLLEENESTNGYLGMNVFNASAVFKNISLDTITKENTYTGGDLTYTGLQGKVVELTNSTLNNVKIPNDYYETDANGLLRIHQEYFDTLEENQEYVLFANTATAQYQLKINVKSNQAVYLTDMEIANGVDAVIYIGNLQIDSVTVNGNELSINVDYKIEGHTLVIPAKHFKAGDNSVEINDENINLYMHKLNTTDEVIKTKTKNTGLIIGLSVGGVIVLLGGVGTLVFVLVKKKDGKEGLHESNN